MRKLSGNHNCTKIFGCRKQSSRTLKNEGCHSVKHWYLIRKFTGWIDIEMNIKFFWIKHTNRVAWSLSMGYGCNSGEWLPL